MLFYSFVPQRRKIDVSLICVSSFAEQVTWPHPGQEWQQHPDLCLHSSAAGEIRSVLSSLHSDSHHKISYSFLSSFQMKMNMNYHIIHFLFWFLYSFICSVKVQIWCKLNAYSFTLDISFLYNFLCDKESGVTVWATTSYFISHMKNTFASATNSD